ncbi:MAG: long-chain-acyl-CoA synthetase [Polyangiales bacterium]
MLQTTRNFQRLIRALVFFDESSNRTLAYQIERRAEHTGGHPFLLYGERRYSYAQANAAINRHAHVYAELGVRRGDVVALCLENRPELLWHVFGLHKLGAVTSLLNTQLAGDVLVHAISVCEPSRLVVGSELWAGFAEIRMRLGPLGRDAVYVDVDPDQAGERGAHEAPSFDVLVAEAPATNPETTAQHKLSDLAAYIYTSGTTGLPKAALVKHERFSRAGIAWSGAMGLRPGDVMYDCLPLYHANGLILAIGSVVTAGATVALARRFSRTRFWADVRKHGATSFIYIGELCRYLLNNAPSASDRDHRVRAITGNGLRPDIWREFQSRFGISKVAEFYAATEGNCITINFANVAGSVGPILPGMALARWSEAKDDFVRDERGFLTEARIGEPGVLLGKIRARMAFDGYRDKRETEGKILRNAFKEGDAYFNTGDLLKVDWWKHLHFVDRLGDTFRWRGENVSTTEVQEQLSKWPAVVEVNVYGVKVPHVEGRAGMAALVLAEGRSFDPGEFKAHVDQALPGYARPLFVRLRGAMAVTATFKLKKHDLQREGFDPTASEDALYFRHPERNEYVRLDPELYARINQGNLRL